MDVDIQPFIFLQVEAVILQRFGSTACRIFRLLLLKNNLEQRQVADLVFTPFVSLATFLETQKLLHRR